MSSTTMKGCSIIPKVKARYINNKSGYVQLYLSNGRIVEAHRYFMECFLKRKLAFNEIVHHKDGNRQNNKLYNLELVSRSNHGKYHAHRGRSTVTLNCDYCGVSFSRERRHVGGRKKHYCGRSCMGYAYWQMKRSRNTTDIVRV